MIAYFCGETLDALCTGIFGLLWIEQLRHHYRYFLLRWDLQNGVVTIPKSTKEHRIVENSSVFDFELTTDDMKCIDSLKQNHRVGPDPDNFDF